MGGTGTSTVPVEPPASESPEDTIGSCRGIGSGGLKIKFNLNLILSDIQDVCVEVWTRRPD